MFPPRRLRRCKRQHSAGHEPSPDYKSDEYHRRQNFDQENNRYPYDYNCDCWYDYDFSDDHGCDSGMTTATTITLGSTIDP